jgi:hypothetical protein
VVCAGPSGVQGLLQQMDSIQTERIGADGQLVAYPLRVAGQLFYFGFRSRRDGIDQLRIRLAAIQARQCEQSALRAEAAARQGRMGRLGRRRTAVVDAVRAPDHNHQLLRLLRGGGGGGGGCSSSVGGDCRRSSNGSIRFVTPNVRRP